MYIFPQRVVSAKQPISYKNTVRYLNLHFQALFLDRTSEFRRNGDCVAFLPSVTGISTEARIIRRFMFNDKAADFSVVGFTGVLVHRGTSGTKRQTVFDMVIFHFFNALHRFKIISVADFERHFVLAALANHFAISIGIFGSKIGFGLGSYVVYLLAINKLQALIHLTLRNRIVADGFAKPVWLSLAIGIVLTC